MPIIKIEILLIYLKKFICTAQFWKRYYSLMSGIKIKISLFVWVYTTT